MISRRALLALLGSGAAGLMFDLELALWKPGSKTIFLPSLTPASFYIGANERGIIVRGPRITERYYERLIGTRPVWMDTSTQSRITFATHRLDIKTHWMERTDGRVIGAAIDLGPAGIAPAPWGD